MENLEIYNKVKEVPKNAQKEIKAGRLKGMTDINPQWRIEKLTEVFGPVGIGWFTKEIKREFIDGANEEKMCFVDIELYVKVDGLSRFMEQVVVHLLQRKVRGYIQVMKL